MKYKTEFFRLFLILSLSIWFIFSLMLVENKLNYKTTKDLKLNTEYSNRSIILMIGDGMGHEHIKLASLIELGENNSFNFHSLSYRGNVSTHNIYNSVTDSAAAATAIATGRKTDNGMLSVLPNNATLETIIEFARILGKSTGIVTTTSLTHATPAAFMSHEISRYSTTEIARQIVEESGVDVMLGGGRSAFTEGQISQLESKGYSFVENNSLLMNSNSTKLFGLFASTDLPYEISRDPIMTPSLSNMTKKAIESLSTNPNGFFLMIEGGKIDYAAHDNNKVNVALETIEFNLAINYSLNYCLENNNTLLIITADHETGGLKVVNHILNDTIPSTIDSYDDKELLRIARANNVSVSWSTTSHTNSNVPFYVFDAISNGLNINGAIDNTQIYEIMKRFFDPSSTIISIKGFPTGIMVIIIMAFVIIKKKVLKLNLSKGYTIVNSTFL